LLEVVYGCIAHSSLVVCQILHVVIQHSLAVRVDAKPSLVTGNVFFILCIIVVGTATLAAAGGWLGAVSCALLLTISRLQYSRTCRCPDWRW
jgi:hypothetical protein